jgi:universal stress protein A
MSHYKHILLTTDFSDGSAQINQRACELSKLMTAKLSVIHVVEPLPGYGYGFVGSAELEIQLVEAAKMKLAELGKSCSIKIENQHVVVGSTKTEIHRMAEDTQVDLIIVGSHGRHGLTYLLGSTASGVIHGARCDVLTVRINES